MRRNEEETCWWEDVLKVEATFKNQPGWFALVGDTEEPDCDISNIQVSITRPETFDPVITLFVGMNSRNRGGEVRAFHGFAKESPMAKENGYRIKFVYPQLKSLDHTFYDGHEEDEPEGTAPLEVWLVANKPLREGKSTLLLRIIHGTASAFNRPILEAYYDDVVRKRSSAQRNISRKFTEAWVKLEHQRLEALAEKCARLRAVLLGRIVTDIAYNQELVGEREEWRITLDNGTRLIIKMAQFEIS